MNTDLKFNDPIFLAHSGEQTPEPDVPPSPEDHGGLRLCGGGRMWPSLLLAQAGHLFALLSGTETEKRFVPKLTVMNIHYYGLSLSRAKQR